MNGKYLLDTNIIIALFRADSHVTRFLESASEVFVPCIALGELFYGARKSSRSEENLARINEFEAGVTVLPCDSDTAWHYGTIKHALKVKGRLIPENDIWIAAIAKVYGLTILTGDAHFLEIEGLPVVSPED